MSSSRFLLSKSKVLEQYKKVKSLCDVVSYSSKTNQLITKILEEETESMFSVHFVNELKHINDLSRVLFLAQGWNEGDIEKLITKGIKSFTVDNEPDLDVLLRFLENRETKINLQLRLKLKENTLKTERYFVFGMSSEIINKRVREIKSNERLLSRINQLGLHFHRKTQNMAEWNYKYEIFNLIEEDVLKMIDVVNIGGGLPSDYTNTNVEVISTIITKIEEFKNNLKEHDIKLMIEPGRFIAAAPCELCTTIIGIHDNNIIVNASVYNSDMDALVVPVKLLVKGELTKEEANEKVKPFVIKGITPCSLDLFRYRVYLKEPKVGDKIVFLNAGAYNFTTNFCDLDEIETEIIE